ncbi:MAG: 4Fe-4S binding protein, partial [Oscillospiraceae bacterium]|nr:4Fe-4S binding protein [Oscillospiraceae bacterium]
GGKSTVSGYSGSAVKPIALRFVRDLAADPALKDVPISGMGGIETWHDAAEFLALGCRNLQVTTAVMQYGYRIIDDLCAGLTLFLHTLGLDRVEELVGRALPNLVDAQDLDRDTVCYPRFHPDSCLGCGRCFLSCYDAGHQAIAFDEDRRPRLIGKNCVGCHLCMLVCPAGAISPARRVAKPK